MKLCTDCRRPLTDDDTGEICQECRDEIEKWETDDRRYNDPRTGQAAWINAMKRRISE